MKALRDYIKQEGRGAVAAIAREMGVSHNTVKRWNAGVNGPSVYRLPKLRAFLAKKVTVITVTDSRGCDVTGK